MYGRDETRIPICSTDPCPGNRQPGSLPCRPGSETGRGEQPHAGPRVPTGIGHGRGLVEHGARHPVRGVGHELHRAPPPRRTRPRPAASRIRATTRPGRRRRALRTRGQRPATGRVTPLGRPHWPPWPPAWRLWSPRERLVRQHRLRSGSRGAWPVRMNPALASWLASTIDWMDTPYRPGDNPQRLPAWTVWTTCAGAAAGAVTAEGGVAAGGAAAAWGMASA